MISPGPVSKTYHGGRPEANVPLNGCRGGIFLYRAFGTTIRCAGAILTVTASAFSNPTMLTSSTVSAKTTRPWASIPQRHAAARHLQLHCPRQRADGLFLCWRVRYGLSRRISRRQRLLRYSIGHKDSDNLLQENWCGATPRRAFSSAMNPSQWRAPEPAGQKSDRG